MEQETELKLATLRLELTHEHAEKLKESESDGQLIITMQQEQHAEEVAKFETQIEDLQARIRNNEEYLEREIKTKLDNKKAKIKEAREELQRESEGFKFKMTEKDQVIESLKAQIAAQG